MKLKKLVIEMCFIGIALAILGLLVGYVINYYKDRKVDWWPEHVWGMLFGTAITGALFHFLCEYYGLNQWYVNQYEPIFD